MTRRPEFSTTDPQQLAMAVIRQALADVGDASKPDEVRQEARAFLDDWDALGFWCTVAGRRRGRA